MKKKRRFFMDEILQTFEVVLVLAMKKTTLALMMWGTTKTPSERKKQRKNKLWLFEFSSHNHCSTVKNTIAALKKRCLVKEIE